MAQPTTLIATPDPEPHPATTGCPDGVAFCSGICTEYDDGYHSSGFSLVDAIRYGRGDTEMALCVSRTEVDGKPGPAEIHFIPALCSDDFILTPERARRLAALLLNAADDADPIPSGAMLLTASALRLGDELLTDEGWQTVRGLMFFEASDQASVFTDERNDDDDSDGWQFHLADPVEVRRPMHAAEPTLNRPERIVVSGKGWCVRCQDDRVITGPRVISTKGVIRVRGRCQTCNKKAQNAFLGLAPWAVDAL
jgi:hypothetical protein